MIEQFYNSKGFNTAKITLTSGLELHYHLSDNPVQHIWQELIKCDELKTDMSSAMTYDESLARLNELTQRVGQPIFTGTVTREQLNDLHAAYVNAASQHIADKQLFDDWHDINNLIHIIECKIDNPLSQYTGTIQFRNEQDPGLTPILEEYKLWLTTNKRWGDLLLGYGTLGKDWVDVSTDNDGTNDLTLQTTVTTETLMMFPFENPFAKYTEKQFYKWAKQTDIEVPLNNLNALSLGRYVLGEIIITAPMLDFHPTVSDWYVPNHLCKLTWNKVIAGSTVESIEFFDSDLYFKTIIDHGQLGSINA